MWVTDSILGKNVACVWVIDSMLVGMWHVGG